MCSSIWANLILNVGSQEKGSHKEEEEEEEEKEEEEEEDALDLGKFCC